MLPAPAYREAPFLAMRARSRVPSMQMIERVAPVSLIWAAPFVVAGIYLMWQRMCYLMAQTNTFFLP